MKYTLFLLWEPGNLVWASYFLYTSQLQNVLILFLFYHLFFLPILILLVSWCDSIHTFDYVFEYMIFFQENTIIGNKAFNTFVFKSIIRVKCLSQRFLAYPVICLRTFSMVYFERPYMSHHLSNLLWKNCTDVTFHVVFVTFCHEIDGCNVKHCVT